MKRKYFINEDEKRKEIVSCVLFYVVLYLLYIILRMLKIIDFFRNAIGIIFILSIIFFILIIMFSPSFSTIEVSENGYIIKEKMKKTFVRWEDINIIRKGIKLEKYTGKQKVKIVIEYYSRFSSTYAIQYLPMNLDLYMDLLKYYESDHSTENNAL